MRERRILEARSAMKSRFEALRAMDSRFKARSAMKSRSARSRPSTRRGLLVMV